MRLNDGDENVLCLPAFRGTYADGVSSPTFCSGKNVYLPRGAASGKDTTDTIGR